MGFRLGLQRRIRFVLLAALSLSLASAPARAASGAKGNNGGKRPPFSLARTAEERRSLFEAWKNQNPQTRSGIGASAPAVAGGGQPYVGRASMVINAAGTVVYTRNFLGANATCDPNERSDNQWTASTAFAVGAVVRPTGFFGANGYRGFNFQATNAGTSGATEPTWPITGVGATVNDNGIVWTAIGFDPAEFSGCTPIQVVSRASGGAETVIAQEGDALPDGSQLSGWAEFMAMNSSGVAAFRAAQAGILFTDQDDEGQSGIFTAGPGAGALTRVAVTGTTVGGRNLCGLSAMVGINNVGQIVYDTYVLDATNPNRCDENDHGLVRFTPGGTGNQLLVQQGSSVGTPAATVVGFGKDDNAGVTCLNCEYESIDGFINAGGHVPVVLNLSDGTQGVFNFTGPGTATQVVRLPTGSIGPRASINDSDQIVYRATTGGVDRLFRFTPPATLVTIVSVGDVVAGAPISSLGAFTDINSAGNVVFQGQISAGAQDAYFYWDGAVTRVTTGPVDTLASEMISVNNANQVAYVTGTTSSADETDGGAEGHEDGGIFFWTLAGGSVKAIQVGDVINADTVTAIYAEHTSFVRRQFSQAGCIATAYMVLGDDPEFDCDEGGVGSCNPVLQRGGLLFISCGTGVCPTITLAPPTLPAATQASPYSQQIAASGGQAPYTFAVTVGTLPAGLTLTTGGLLSGTPTATGTFNFTVTATDANVCLGSLAYSLVIGSPTQVTIALSPGARTVVVGTNGSLTAIINIVQASDTIVTLTSGNPSIASVPPTVTIPAGQTSAPFTVTGVTVGGPITITATLPPSFNASPATASITVVDAPAAAVPTLSFWALLAFGLALAVTGWLVANR